MKVAWLAVVLSLAPGIAAAQTPGTPPTAPGTVPEPTPAIPGVPGTVAPSTQPIDPSVPGTAPVAPGPGPVVPGAPVIVDPTLPPGTPPVPGTQPPGTLPPTPRTGAPRTPPLPEAVPPSATMPGPPRVIGPTLPGLPTGTTAPEAPGLIIGVPPGQGFPTEISPRIPPSPTIPSGPSVILPTPLPAGARTGRLFYFQPTLRIIEEWTDNFNRSENNPISNFRTTLAPGAQILLDRGTLTGSAAYTLSAFHDSSLGEFGVHNSLAALLSWQAIPTWRLTLSEAFVQSDDPERTDRLLLTRQRREATSNQTSLTSEYSLLALGLDTRQYYRYSHFDSTSTTDAHTFGLSASRALDRIHVLTLGYEYLMSDSTRNESATGSRDSSVRGHQVLGTLSRDVSARLTAGLTGAYATRDLEGTNGPSSYERWNMAVFGNYALVERLIARVNVGFAHLSATDETIVTTLSTVSYWFGPATATVGFERGFSETFGQSEDFGVVKTTGVFASLLYRFSPLLSGEVNASYRENDFTGIGGSAAVNGGADARDDTVYSAGVRFIYQITRGLNASLDAAHIESEGRAGRSFSENRVRAALSAILY